MTREYQVGDRVQRVSHVDGHVIYEATIADVSVVHDRGVKKRLYQLTRQDGSVSPIKVTAAGLKPVEET